MKKEYKFLSSFVIFGFLFSAPLAFALTFPSDNTYPKYILITKPQLPTQQEKIEKAWEKLEKDNEDNYKRLQDDLKSLNSRIDIQIKTGFYCVYPTQSCTESIYGSIRGIAISSGLTPDANQLAQCRAQIDQYNQKLQEYNQCQQNWQNEKINSSSQSEYQYQLEVYELKSEISCINKEGYYSSFNKKTKECECVEGSTFVNGKCVNELQQLIEKDNYCKNKEGHYSEYNKDTNQCACIAGATFIKGICQSDTQIKIDNHLGCVKNYGVNAKYDSSKNVCVCIEGSKLNLESGNCVIESKDIVSDKPATHVNKYSDLIPKEKPVKNTKKSEVKTQIKTDNEIKLVPAVKENFPIQKSERSGFWSRFLLKLKFW